MAKSKSSRRWLDEHFNDPFVKKAHSEGLRARSIYKLEEIDKKYGLIKSGMAIVDLGAAPGGWSHFAIDKMKHNGTVIGLDMLPIDPINDVTFIQGDFTEEAVLQQLLEVLDGQAVDLVMSDLAPNMSGIRSADQARSMYLVELALEFAKQVLKPGGSFLVKLFHGEGFDEYVKASRLEFDKVKVYKPEASRSRSQECYLLGMGRKEAR